MTGSVGGDETLLLLKTFYECGVRYLIAGGFAVNRYGYQRATGDVNIYLKDTKLNKTDRI